MKYLGNSFGMGKKVLLLMLFCLNMGAEAQQKDLPRKHDAALVDVVADFIRATQTRPQRPDSIQVHSLMLLKHGQVVYEQWFGEHTPTTPHVMHSVSKTFTSAAAGLAIQEKKLRLTDKVISFFPDKLPAHVSDNLAQMTVRDLLTMNCGHNQEPRAAFNDPQCDWVREFLAWPVEHKPGTYYLYNSMGTYMVSAIIQKVTGQKVADYLSTRLFQPLGIRQPQWDESPQGINCGGWGLHITTEDMAKLGQLFLSKGKWNGRRVMPAKWLKEMSSPQVPSAPAGTPFEKLAEYGITPDKSDWVNGYGYQMWMGRHHSFRADGKDGQYIIVLPDRDAVIVLTTQSTLYQPYMDLIWEKLLPAL